MKAHGFTHSRISLPYLSAAFLVLAAGLLLLYTLRVEQPNAYADVQLKAAERMARAERFLLETVNRENIPIEEDDINRTGLIGPEWSPLTTSLGLLEAKRSSLNPNMAALMVEYFYKAGLKAGDPIAVGSSGSFPGLAVATLCAATEMKLDTRCIASFGSSMYGGTRPELSTVRILKLLKEQGIVDMELLAVSPGGDNDYGENVLYEDGRDIILNLARNTGVEVIDCNDIVRSIRRRLELFGDVRCFVNVGGASVNMGTSAYTLTMPNGLVLNPPPIPSEPDRGLMFEYAARSLPVIHLLNVRKLCLDNGLPFDPVPLPKPGEGGVYRHTAYSVPLAIIVLLVVITLLYMGRRDALLRRAEDAV